MPLLQNILITEFRSSLILDGFQNVKDVPTLLNELYHLCHLLLFKIFTVGIYIAKFWLVFMIHLVYIKKKCMF